MNGTFKGWLPNKSFGFVLAEDGGRDVFLHQSALEAPAGLKAGAVLEFEVDDTPDGKRAARNVVVLSTPQQAPARTPHPDYPAPRTGTIRRWDPRGFGFIVPDDRGEDVFVHRSAAGVGVQLVQGDNVLFRTAQGQKGIEAYSVQVCGWRSTGDPLNDFADMGPAFGAGGWLETLVNLAEDEGWTYRNTPSNHPCPVLESYTRYTFHRLQEMDDGVRATGDRAAFNTGLVTRHQEEIYALFQKNQTPDRQPWRFRGFRKASDREFLETFGARPPPLATYFDDPSVLLYDRRCELYVNIDHVLEHISRFPAHLQQNEYVARQLLLSAEAQTKKRVYRNYKTAIPQFFRDQGKAGSVQLLLPICLEDPMRADLALVVERTRAGDAYRGSTVLTLDMAYNNARLLARPDTEWLQP